MSTRIEFEDGSFAIVNPLLGTLFAHGPDDDDGRVAIALDSAGALNLAAALTEYARELDTEPPPATQSASDVARRLREAMAHLDNACDISDSKLNRAAITAARRATELVLADVLRGEGGS